MMRKYVTNLACATVVSTAVLAALSGCSVRIEMVPDGNGWPQSAEFSQLSDGQTRFSSHDSGMDGSIVVVDHETGVQYLATATGICPLYEADGSLMLVGEADRPEVSE